MKSNLLNILSMYIIFIILFQDKLK